MITTQVRERLLYIILYGCERDTIGDICEMRVSSIFVIYIHTNLLLKQDGRYEYKHVRKRLLYTTLCGCEGDRTRELRGIAIGLFVRESRVYGPDDAQMSLI